MLYMEFLTQRIQNIKWRYSKVNTELHKEIYKEEEKNPIELEVIENEEDNVPLLQDTDNGTSREELKTLRRVPDDIPTGKIKRTIATWYIVLCELCERFTFYGVSGPFQNYIEFPAPKNLGEQSGAIGKGQQAATALSLFFSFFSYVTPIIGAIVADQYLGKYKTILCFSIIYITGLSVLTITATPIAISSGASLPGLVLAMIIIGLGAGGIKTNVSVMVAEQYTKKKSFIRTLKNGEKVIVDPKLTIQSIFAWFYVAINLGAISPIVTTTVEKYHSFWLAFLIPLIICLISVTIFYIGRNKYVHTKPSSHGSIILNAIKVIRITLMNKRDFEKAKPSQMIQFEQKENGVSWNDQFVDELRSAINACRVFMFFPIYSAAFNQLYANLVSQAATMRPGILPNDIMSCLDPITFVIIVPLIDRVFYPFLRGHGISFGSITRIFIGMMFASAAMIYSALIQWWIYNTGPCYRNTHCLVDGKATYNDISIWWQAPIYFMLAICGAFASVTSLEFAFQKAPISMKSIVTALYLTTHGLGAAIGLLIVPLAHDPYNIYVYVILALITFIAASPQEQKKWDLKEIVTIRRSNFLSWNWEK
ncbi:3533_t:CDS:2 [Ambispora gerdemannii]|uniref:3533_t:CDS:1 n=1 Tax=Ambispora gerdemannii TaxID=144530 RepID=A0A9N9AR44_9GLOM|nr:3533_t:CDS:2 [Ambispora gerdemannii]